MAVRTSGKQTPAEKYAAWKSKMPEIGPVGQLVVSVPWLLIAGTKSLFARIYVAQPSKWRAAAKAEAAKPETDEGAKVKQQARVSGLKRNALLYNLFTLVLTAVLLWFLAGPTIGAVRGTFRWLGGAPPAAEITGESVSTWAAKPENQLALKAIAEAQGIQTEPQQQAWLFDLMDQGSVPTTEQFKSVIGADGQEYRLALMKDAEGFVGVLVEGAAAPQPVQNGQAVKNNSGITIGILTFNPTGEGNELYGPAQAMFIAALPK